MRLLELVMKSYRNEILGFTKIYLERKSKKSASYLYWSLMEFRKSSLISRVSGLEDNLTLAETVISKYFPGVRFDMEKLALDYRPGLVLIDDVLLERVSGLGAKIVLHGAKQAEMSKRLNRAFKKQDGTVDLKNDATRLTEKGNTF